MNVWARACGWVLKTSQVRFCVVDEVIHAAAQCGSDPCVICKALLALSHRRADWKAEEERVPFWLHFERLQEQAPGPKCMLNVAALAEVLDHNWNQICFCFFVFDAS